MKKEPTSSSTLCPVCGTRLPENANRCLVCGTEIAPKAAAEDAVPKTIQGSRMPEITLSLPAAMGFLALFLSIGAILVFFLVRQQPQIAVPPTETPTPTLTVTPSPTATPVTPTPTNTPEPTPTPFTYTVASGDNCITIAYAFDVSVQSIVLLNNLPATCSNLTIGQKLQIPYPTATPTPFPTATLSPFEATRQACPKVDYKVQANDTLSTIAANYAIPIQAIKDWNGLVSDNVRAGQTLILPLCQQGFVGVTPTPTIPPPYAGPNLLLPVDGAVFDTASQTVTLQWASVGVLAANEAYQVTIEDITNGDGRRLVDYVNDTKFTVPDTFQPTETGPHVFRWSVQAVRQSGTNDQGLPVYQPAGSASVFRVFVWSRPSSP